MGKGTRGRMGRAGHVDFVQVFSAPKRSVPWQITSLLIRARAELFVVVVVVTAELWLRSMVTPVQAHLIIAGTVAVLVVLPWSRRFLVARVWCVMDRHRLRACLQRTKVRTMNMDGSLPLMVWAWPTKTGERVWLWIRAGSSGGDIEDALEYIAPACLARSARLHRVRSITTIVAIEVIRRDPLAKSTISSPLARLTGRFRGMTPVDGTEPITPAPLASVVDLSQREHTPVPMKTTRMPAASSAVPVVVVNGEDLSDYVD